VVAAAIVAVAAVVVHRQRKGERLPTRPRPSPARRGRSPHRDGKGAFKALCKALVEVALLVHYRVHESRKDDTNTRPRRPDRIMRRRRKPDADGGLPRARRHDVEDVEPFLEAFECRDLVPERVTA